MKWYCLTNKEFKDSIDLTCYESDIMKAVHKVRPDAEVIVREDAFCIEPELSKREMIAISQMLRANSMAAFTYYRPSLFISHTK